MSRFLPPIEIRGRTLDIPVVQGGMGVGVARYLLTGTVAGCGGMGTLAAQGLGNISTLPLPEGEEQRRRRDDPHRIAAVGRETRAAVELAGGRGIVAVNVMSAITHYEALVEVAVANGAQAIVTGAGMPLQLPGVVGDADVALIPIVSSVRALRLLCRHWSTFHGGRLPDAVIVEGPKAGGHLGFGIDAIDAPESQLEALIPQIVEEAARWGGGFPVIAAGGIWDHDDAWRMLELGASAVQLGTRFVVTTECDVAAGFKERYLACTRDDIALIRTPVGMIGRVLRTPLIERFEQGRFPGFKCRYQCLKSCVAHEVKYCIADHLLDAARGNEDGLYFIGTNGWRCSEILDVATLMDRLQRGELPQARRARNGASAE